MCPAAVIDRAHIPRVPVPASWPTCVHRRLPAHVADRAAENPSRLIQSPSGYLRSSVRWTSSRSSSVAETLYGVFICSTFFLRCRFSRDNSSDKSTAEYGGKKKKKEEFGAKQNCSVRVEGSHGILPLLSHRRAVFVITALCGHRPTNEHFKKKCY